MKKACMLWLILLMVFLINVPVLASVMYANQDTVPAFEEQTVQSDILRTFNGGDPVLIETISSDQIWAGVLAEDPNGEGQTIAWVPMSALSYSMPSRYCSHQWSEWTIQSRATCTTNGLMTRGCLICGLTESEEIAMTGHYFGGWQVTKQATCISDGEMVRNCSVCGYQEKTTIQRTGHSFGEWTVTRQPTCTLEGESVHKCTVCGYEERQALALLPHTFGEWVVTKAPTCTQTGESVHKCTVCGYEEIQALALLPHTFEWKTLAEVTDHSSGAQGNVCSVCGFVQDQISIDPEGTLRRGDMGEQVRQLQQLLADQDYLSPSGVDGVFGAATETALTQFQQSQDLFPDGVAWPQTQKKLLHDYNLWVTTKSMTRDEAGERERSCKDCSYVQRQSVSPGPVYVKGDRGEGVRTLQRMLTTLGYDTGNPDGIYGALLDTALEGFAKEKSLSFTPGTVNPSLIDAVTNSWIASHSKKLWMGNKGSDATVNLSLTITPASDEEVISIDQSLSSVTEKATEETTAASSKKSKSKKDKSATKAQKESAKELGKIVTYHWSLKNLGEEDCTFVALLLRFGNQPNFRKKNMVMVLDGTQLKAKGGNSVSGSFYVSTDWGNGDMNLCALAVKESTGAQYLSNVGVFNLISNSFFGG